MIYHELAIRTLFVRFMFCPFTDDAQRQTWLQFGQPSLLATPPGKTHLQPAMNHMHARARPGAVARVTAILGPTNTGKTHFAIERMVAHKSGMIGLPLRLLAREVYDRVVAKVGVDSVALITGEERIKPANPRYWVSTVEAMPRDLDTDFVAVDEIQLAADPERGHVFTERLFSARGHN